MLSDGIRRTTASKNDDVFPTCNCARLQILLAGIGHCMPVCNVYATTTYAWCAALSLPSQLGLCGLELSCWFKPQSLQLMQVRSFDASWHGVKTPR